MRKSKAIKVFKQQIEKLDDEKIHKDYFFVMQTKTYIEHFLGEKSDQFKYISSFNFPYYDVNSEIDKTTREYLDIGTNAIKKLLNDCIEIIQTKGLENNNFLRNLGNSTIIGIITFLIPSLLSVGYLFGVSTTDSKNVELRQDNKALIKENIMLKDSLATKKNVDFKTTK